MCRSGDPPGFPYGENVIFVANDWHAGLVPAYIAGKYRRNGVYKDARCIIAIHNLSHQGVDPAATYSNLGLPSDWYCPNSPTRCCSRMPTSKVLWSQAGGDGTVILNSEFLSVRKWMAYSCSIMPT